MSKKKSLCTSCSLNSSLFFSHLTHSKDRNLCCRNDILPSLLTDPSGINFKAAVRCETKLHQPLLNAGSQMLPPGVNINAQGILIRLTCSLVSRDLHNPFNTSCRGCVNQIELYKGNWLKKVWICTKKK